MRRLDHAIFDLDTHEITHVLSHSYNNNNRVTGLKHDSGL